MNSVSLPDFHNSSKSTFTPTTQLPSKFWPEEWRTTYYKEYPRFEAIALPAARTDTPLSNIIQKRTSTRTFSSTGLSLQQIADLLQHIGGEFVHPDVSTHRAQASAGARFGVEIYVIVRFSASGELQSGVYHYNVKSHALEYLWPLDAHGTNPDHLVIDAWANQASVQLVFTAVFWRSTQKYGNRGYRYICMETGAMLQNAYLHAAANNLAIVGYGGTNDDVVEQLLQLNTEQESVIGSCLLEN